MKPTALSNWENGARAISLDITDLDHALNGGGVLAGLLWALGTPEGREPDRFWSKVFPGPSAPVWAWIRSEDERLQMVGEWGIARVESDLELGPNGAFLTVGASVPVSPIVIEFSKPAWVDFGWGTLPPSVPGAPATAAIDIAVASTNTSKFMDIFFGNLRDRFRGAREPDLTRIDSSSPGAIGRFFSGFEWNARPRRGAWQPLPTGLDEIERQRFARMRRARRLSLVEAADLLEATTGVIASKDTLRRFEFDVGEPHDRLLPAALDHMLGAEGTLATVVMRSDSGDGAVHFPSYWNGPIWIEFAADPSAREPVEDTPVVLEFGDWGRELLVSPPALVLHHYCAAGVPLRISTSENLRWTAGVGRRGGAAVIDHGWAPMNVDVARDAVSEVEQALLDALQASSDEGKAQDTGAD